MRTACMGRACRYFCPASRHSRPRTRRFSCQAATTTSQHDSYLQSKAGLQAPQHLSSLLKVFESKGHILLQPSDQNGLHPFFVPISQGPAPDAATSGESSTIYGLLHWPVPARASAALSVVYMTRGGRNVSLLSRNVDDYLHRILVEEDVKQPGGGPVAAALGSASSQFYKPGTIQELGLQSKLELYTIRKIGMFMDVCESLAEGHLKRGDVTSALVAGEWYMRGNNFPGWARPYEFASQVLHKLNRLEESRDTSRVALRLPWWTLKSGFEAAVQIADLSGTPEHIKFVLSEEAQIAVASQMGSSVKMGEPKPPEQLALEAANTLMDMVAAGVKPSWDSIRQELSDLYRAAALEQASRFVLPS